MSKQLTLSSILAVAAMATLALLSTIHQRAGGPADSSGSTWQQEAALPEM